MSDSRCADELICAGPACKGTYGNPRRRQAPLCHSEYTSSSCRLRSSRQPQPAAPEIGLPETGRICARIFQQWRPPLCMSCASTTRATRGVSCFQCCDRVSDATPPALCLITLQIVGNGSEQWHDSRDRSNIEGPQYSVHLREDTRMAYAAEVSSGNGQPSTIRQPEFHR